MERVPLSVFVNFMLASGVPKLEVAKGFKDHRYDAEGLDFYRLLRSAIVALHQEGHTVALLDGLLATLTDQRKRKIYPGLVEGYKRWHARALTGDVKSFPAPHTLLPIGELEVDLRPDIGVVIDGAPHLILLSFNGFTAARADLTLALLARGLGPTRPGTTFAVLDVARGHLHTLQLTLHPRTGLLARGEAASFLRIYEGV